ncbi:MAG: FmdE family protein, partial [Desulfocucumaceae bacterium]
MEKTPWERVCEFHGHVCPGLAIGFRAATLALKKMDFSRSVDEELIAIVENNACGVDAVQVLAGCTFGKGNLFFLDHGKQVYTFARRSHGKAVRVAVRYGAFHDPELSALRRKVNSGEATGEEKREFTGMQRKHIENILNS